MKNTLTGLKGTPIEKYVYFNGYAPLTNCPKCGNFMRKYCILDGRGRWECSHCGYKEEIK